MKRFVLTGCVFLLVLPLLLTACWPFDRGGGGCQPQYVYDHIADQGRMLVVTDSEQAGNNSGRDATFTLTAERSTTVMVSADTGVEADLGAIVQGVRAHLNVSVSTSVTASIGNTTTITIPPGETGYGDYGVFVQLASGHLYGPNCGQDYGAHVTSRIPIRAGWCVWVTGESPASCESAPAGQPVSFMVTSINATVSQPTYDCSQSRITFNFSATITITPGSSGGNITYTWARSDGGTMAPVTIAVPAGQTTVTVNITWTLGVGAPPGSYWEQVVVTEPNSRTSNEATFTKSC